jgi:DNA invertase Pin-like site-specific DNA recombinase
MAPNDVCAILKRVSDAKQGGEGQDNTLQPWADARGLVTWHVWSIHDSAWKPRSGKGKEFDQARAEILEGARMGKFKILIIWALDRLSRRGIRDTLAMLEKLHEYGVEVWSKEEPWLQTQGDMWEMQVAMFAWKAKGESDRRSSRMTDSIAGRKAAGKRVGRKPGSKDKKPRKRSGYVASWEEGGARREAGGLERERDEQGRFQTAS